MAVNLVLESYYPGSSNPHQRTTWRVDDGGSAEVVKVEVAAEMVFPFARSPCPCCGYVKPDIVYRDKWPTI